MLKNILQSCLLFVLATSLNWAIAQPTISSFSPTSGKPGDAVTISGTNFNTSTTNNVVFFGATRAAVSSATATSLTVTVPVGATYSPITVLNIGTNLAAYSLSSFRPIFLLPKSAITTNDFSSKVDFTAGSGTGWVAIGDLDGDGKPDLAITSQNSDVVSVLRNTSSSGSISSGSFATKVDFTTGSFPVAVAIGDLDGDGKPDLAVVNMTGTSISVLRNTATSGSIASGSFASHITFATGARPRNVFLGDLDGDGKPDLAVANENGNTVSVFRNTSTSGSITSGSFATQVTFATGSRPTYVALGDLDGDGKQDMAVSNYNSNSVSVLRNTASSGSITSGSFATQVSFTTGTGPHTVALGDMDGDGKLDLVLANNGAYSVSVLRNTASSGSITSGSFATSVDFATSASSQFVSIGDFDGDGKSDMVATDWESNTLSVFRNTSTSGSITSGSFAANVYFTTGTGAVSIAVGDLDGDGKPEIAAACIIGNVVSVFRNADYYRYTTTQSINDFYLASGGTLIVDNGVTLTINDTFSHSGGTLTIGNTNLVLAGTLDVSGGATLTTGGKITLASGARIANLSDNSGGSISGNITVERFIPASRKFRFLSHPFNTAQNLSILTDDIDITGNTTGLTDGNAKTLGTGFTATTASVVVNNPSAFWFSTTNANGQSYDGGWSAFTSADGTGSNNTWGVGEGIRVLLRGAKGQGLNGNAYTPSDVTLDMTGTVNTGNVNIDLLTGGSGSASGFNLIGNPYASPVDISAVVFASAGVADINKTIYTRNPQTGSYTSQLLSNGVAYNIPSYTGVFIRNTGASTVTLPFTEARKNGKFCFGYHEKWDYPYYWI